MLGALRSMKALRSSCVFIFSWRTLLELIAAAIVFINLRDHETGQECTDARHGRLLSNNGSTYDDVKDIKGTAQFLKILKLR